MSRALVLAMLPAAVWSTATGETRWAVGGHTAPRIGIFLDFDSDPSESSLEIMRREVGAALAVTGAHFSWLKLKKAAQSETFDQLAVLRFRGKCRMEKLGLKADIPTAPLTLGETGLISGDVSVYSSVECDRIKTCISGLLGTSCARDRETAFGRALARVVAHELYHMLANTTEHTRSGIAKSLQSSFDLIRGKFQFDRKALHSLRQRLFSQGGAGNPAGKQSSFVAPAFSGGRA